MDDVLLRLYIYLINVITAISERGAVRTQCLKMQNISGSTKLIKLNVSLHYCCLKKLGYVLTVQLRAKGCFEMSSKAVKVRDSGS